MKTLHQIKGERKPLFENDMCKQVGLRATCNNCDRIIWEDENYLNEYIESNGYCKQCNEENQNNDNHRQS